MRYLGSKNLLHKTLGEGYVWSAVSLYFPPIPWHCSLPPRPLSGSRRVFSDGVDFPPPLKCCFFSLVVAGCFTAVEVRSNSGSSPSDSSSANCAGVWDFVVGIQVNIMEQVHCIHLWSCDVFITVASSVRIKLTAFSLLVFLLFFFFFFFFVNDSLSRFSFA